MAWVTPCPLRSATTADPDGIVGFRRIHTATWPPDSPADWQDDSLQDHVRSALRRGDHQRERVEGFMPSSLDGTAHRVRCLTIIVTVPGWLADQQHSWLSW